MSSNQVSKHATEYNPEAFMAKVDELNRWVKELAQDILQVRSINYAQEKQPLLSWSISSC